MYLIAGLGNPGEKYFATRHNVGFSAIDYLSQKNNIPVGKLKHKALIGEGTLCGQKVILAKPQTFMNLSGESVAPLAAWYKIPPENIILLYDDVSLPLGSLRIRTKGSDGGHNGVKSVILHLNSDAFGRMKIGVGAPVGETDLVDHVLGKLTDHEKAVIFDVLGSVNDAVLEYIQNGAESSMNLYNHTEK